MTKLQNLIAIREHLRDGIENNRVKLSKMWANGNRSGFVYQRTLEQYERAQNKLTEIENKIFDLCPVGSPSPHITK